MALVPGFAEAFDASIFREAIKNTMQLGSPNEVRDKATFKWDRNFTTDTMDPSGVPYDFAEVIVDENEHPDVLVDCAVEFVERAPTGTPLGQFDNPRIVITLLDVDYVLVSTANMVVLGGNDYKINFWAPPVGLLDVTVFQAYCTAIDES
jgi:hypothetical protein